LLTETLTAVAIALSPRRSNDNKYSP
jgi:hypothetical protein